MTDSERTLLLTVGRIMRVRLLETRISKNDDDDLRALHEALTPFDPTPGVVLNEYNGGDTPPI